MYWREGMIEERFGSDKLSCWFELSYASFLTMPRVAMEAMPDEWQGKMADLLNEVGDEFPNFPKFKYMVQRKEGNKFAKFPEWLLNYKHFRPSQSKEWKNK